MNANKVILISSGFVAGLIAGVIIMSVFSGSSGGSRVSQAPAPVSPAPTPGPDKLRLAQDIRQLEEIVAKDPQNYQGWVQLGNNHFDMNEPQKAIDAYRKALAITDKDPNVWTDMGVMYRAIKDFPSAVASFKKAMTLDARHTTSRYNLGVVSLHDLNDYPGAIAAWEAFLAIEPPGPRADQIGQQIEQLRKLAAGQPKAAPATDLDQAARELGKSLNPPPAR